MTLVKSNYPKWTHYKNTFAWSVSPLRCTEAFKYNRNELSDNLHIKAEIKRNSRNWKTTKNTY